jgi:hypothetical protein
MSDEEIALVHILEYFSRKCAVLGLPVPRKDIVLSHWFMQHPEYNEDFLHFLQKEFRLECNDTLRILLRDATARDLAFFIARVAHNA